MKILNKLLLIGAILISFSLSFTCQADSNLSDWNTVLDKGAGSGGAGYDITQISPDPLIAKVIGIALSFLGVIFLILMILGGYQWMTARGNEDQVKKARDLIYAAIIGLIIVLISYVVSEFVVKALTENTLE